MHYARHPDQNVPPWPEKSGHLRPPRCGRLAQSLSLDAGCGRQGPRLHRHRTGRWVAFEHSGIEPDLVLTAKSIAAGMPLAAVTGRAEILDAPHVGGIGSTYGGNPLACAAALKALELMEKADLNGRTEQIGEIMLGRFQAWKERFEIIGDVRGLGAMLAIEFINGPSDHTPNTAAPLKIVEDAYKRGLMFFRAGLYANCVRTLVPLTITDEELDEGLHVLGDAIAVPATA